MENEQSMTMLYKATQGIVKESHYGLKLACVVPLPPGLVDHATFISQKLEHAMLRKQKAADTILKEKRRKLILNLKEHLVQAQSGVLEGEVLTAWLRELQKEFVTRMTALEEEAGSFGQESGDEEMGDAQDHDEEEMSSRQRREHSVITISSGTSSAESGPGVLDTSESSTVRAVSDNER